VTITREIIRDLLPAYWSGEASADTRAAVEAYFEQEPTFAEEARREARALEYVEHVPSYDPDPATRLAALQRAKRILRTQRILFALASTLSLNMLSLGFSFEIGSGTVKVHWLALPGQAWAVGALTLAAVVTWLLYFRVHRQVRMSVMG